MVYEAPRFDLIVWRGVFRFRVEFSTFVALKQAIKNKPQILNPSNGAAYTQVLRISLAAPNAPLVCTLARLGHWHKVRLIV